MSDQQDALQAVFRAAPPEALPEALPEEAYGPHRNVKMFARRVAERIEGQILRHSVRVELIELAETLGIGRFHANLVIAAVQHQLGQLSISPPADPPATGRWAVWGLLLLAQSAVLLAAWALFIR